MEGLKSRCSNILVTLYFIIPGGVCVGVSGVSGMLTDIPEPF